MTIETRKDALAVDQLTKSYGAIKILENVSFHLARGEIAALLGPSGCGKSTTLRSIAGFVSPDRGRISINGIDVTHRMVHERDFGIVFQDYALFPHLTVRENVEYGLRHRRYTDKPFGARVGELLDLVRMSEFADRYPSQLSGGQKQRIALARALAPNPAVLLLDEPLSALDTSVRSQLQNELRAVLRQVGITTVIVTHDHEEAAVLADQVLLMNRGRIEQTGRPLEIYDRPATRFSAEFLGDVNWITGKFKGWASPGCAEIALADDVSLKLQARELPGVIGSAVQFGLRPEAIRFSSDGELDCRFAGTVKDVVKSRTSVQVEVAIAGEKTVKVIHRRDNSAPAVGESVRMSFAPESVFCLS